VTAVICAKDEADNIAYVLVKVPIWVDEIVVVDGHSTDKTAEVSKLSCPRAIVVEQPKQGKGDALRFGIENATSEIVVTLDADGQTDPADIPLFLRPLVRGADFSKGTRLKAGRPASMSLHKFIGNEILVLSANLLFRARYTDIAAGLRAFYKAKVVGIRLTDGGEADQEFHVRILKEGLSVVEIPYTHLPRLTGRSRFRDVPQGLRNLSAIVRVRLGG
jgi:glycosyltransferase involved in cell wall biosynthesis